MIIIAFWFAPKSIYINETGTVIYRSKMTHGNNNKKNFEVYTAEEFIAAITQHIPEKLFQIACYYDCGKMKDHKTFQ
jgi:hypothetical protein